MCYSAITGYLGFEVNEGEYKVMGLAPYGQPKYLKQIGQLIEAGPGGEYRLNLNIIRSYKKTECFPRIFANCWETRRALTDRRLARFMHERFSSGPNARK